jgi:hypothetical protein
MRVQRPISFFIIAAMLCALSACSWVGRYSETAYQQLLTLKQLHLQFIATAATDDNQRLAEEDAQIRQQFDQAMDSGDALRRDNLTLLESNYLRVYAHRTMQDAPFSAAEATYLSRQTIYLYQQAIAGERQRPGGE